MRHGGTESYAGYVKVFLPNHPMADKRGHVVEHRLVMSEYLGRSLTDNEIIHHKNGSRSDNRIENLELWIRSHPTSQRAEDLVTWAREILKLYGEEDAA